MYIVVIAWMYVILMVSLFQSSVFRGIVTFVGAGLLPLALILYLFGAPQRRRNRAEEKNPQPTDAAGTAETLAEADPKPSQAQTPSAKPD
jgi:membrane protein implicated in regulation of membrane protease activity